MWSNKRSELVTTVLLVGTIFMFVALPLFRFSKSETN